MHKHRPGRLVQRYRPGPAAVAARFPGITAALRDPWSDFYERERAGDTT